MNDFLTKEELILFIQNLPIDHFAIDIVVEHSMNGGTTHGLNYGLNHKHVTQSEISISTKGLLNGPFNSTLMYPDFKKLKLKQTLTDLIEGD